MRREPNEERTYQERLSRQRAEETRQSKQMALDAIRNAEDHASLCYALAEYLEQYT